MARHRYRHYLGLRLVATIHIPVHYCVSRYAITNINISYFHTWIPLFRYILKTVFHLHQEDIPPLH